MDWGINLKYKAQPKKPKSVKLILWRYFTLIALLVSTVISLLSISIVNYSTYLMTRDKLASISSELNGVIGMQNNVAQQDNLSTLIYRLENNNSVEIYILDIDGAILFGRDEQLENKHLNTNLQKMKQSGNPVMYRENADYYYLSSVIYQKQECSTLVVFHYSFYSQTQQTFVRCVLIVTALILLISLIISYLLAQKLSDPLKSMAQTADEMAKGNYEVSFASAEYEEVSHLSDSLNYAKEEIKKSEQFQRELLANVSHDLKTPLTMIKAYASMIQEISGDNKAKRDQHLQVIIDESDRLAGLVNDVLNVSKISSNIDQINKKVFNLTDLLYGILNKFNYLQDTQNYHIYVDIDADLYTYGDAEKLSQVIYNLISNAVNYTGEDKNIYIQLKDDVANKRIHFTARDTGKGISKDHLPYIWDRYYRVQEEHERPVKGTGLGLHIVKTILQKHGFDYGVKSKQGEGSTFWIDFPEVESVVPTI